QPEKPILSPPSTPRHMHPPRDISISHVLQASMDKPISEDNKGAQMLLNMGWRKGEGLGKNRSGIVDPVKAQQYGQGSGIGKSL
ncbi:G-patch-domain-containing protein, partial [Rhizopus microsporus var. microsporus]